MSNHWEYHMIVRKSLTWFSDYSQRITKSETWKNQDDACVSSDYCYITFVLQSTTILFPKRLFVISLKSTEIKHNWQKLCFCNIDLRNHSQFQDVIKHARDFLTQIWIEFSQVVFFKVYKNFMGETYFGYICKNWQTKVKFRYWQAP